MHIISDEGDGIGEREGVGKGRGMIDGKGGDGGGSTGQKSHCAEACAWLRLIT